MTESESPSQSADEGRGLLLAEITRRIIQLHKEFYGRGPTKGRTYWQEDVITVVLRGGFTRAEETLREAGHGDTVTEQRRAFQDAMRERFKNEITALTGRKVIGFMSGVQQESDMVAEVFVLERQP